MELTIKQLYSDYENKGIVRELKGGKLQEVNYGDVESEESTDKYSVDC